MASRLARSDSRESVFSNASCVSGVGEWQIGDRVRLDNKIGTLAYVGHTKFAPGEWIGLILDTPDGKNNGTVQGVAYFTCEDNHGIFCKSSKLERMAHSPAVGSPIRESNNRYTSEFGLEIGDRVMVSGGKIGYLRYLGPSDFAEGIWCGVELDQPMGKNDGTVQGKRYFACKPLHGLFAPAIKTEKAPKLDTPSRIRVHHNKASVLRSQKGGGSQESLNSIGASSISSRLTTGTGGGPVKRSVARTINASTNETLVKALQETIQEKDRHLEQMIHELDLERNETAEVTARCEELGRRLACGEGSLDQEKLRRIEKLENERKAMKTALIEKDKTIEDLQFRLEEEEMMRLDKESTTKELQEKLAKINSVEAVNTFDSVNMEVKNAQYILIREELEKITASRDKLEEEKGRSENVIHDMKTTLEDTEERMRKLEIDFEKVMNDLEEESTKSVSAVKELNEERKKGQYLASNMESVGNERDEARKEIEILKLTMESLKTATNCAVCVELASERDELVHKLEMCNREMNGELDTINSNCSTLQSQLMESQSSAQSMVMELEKMRNAHLQSVNEVEKEKKRGEELKKKIESLEKEIQSLSAELTDVSTKKETIKRRMGELERNMVKDEEEKRLVNEAMQKNRDCMSEMESTMHHLGKEIEELKGILDRTSFESEERKARIDELLSDNTKMKDLMREMTGERDDVMTTVKEMESRLLSVTENNNEVRKKLEKDIQSVCTKLATTEEKLRVKETEVKCAQESLAAIKSSMEVTKMGDDEKAKELSGVREELANERTSGEEMKRRNNKLTEDLDEKNMQLQDIKHEKKERDEKMEKELGELKKEIENIEGELKMSKKREEMEKRERERVEGDKKNIEEQIRRTTVIIDESVNKREELEKKLHEAEEDKERLNNELKKEREARGKEVMESTEWSRKYEEIKIEMMKSTELLQVLNKRDEEWRTALDRIENLTYEKNEVMHVLDNTRKEKNEMEAKMRHMVEQNESDTNKDAVNIMRLELEGERKKYDDLLSQKRQAHELFDELERNWRKKEIDLAEKLDAATAQLEIVKKKTANEQMKELQNEVDLLRSIVAERVKKEEKYKKEIEILKNMPLDSTPVRKEKKEMAPRKFCDICEVFDTHDTEDCPTQSMEPIDPSPKKTKMIPPSRDYCDSCQEFGHDTSACANLFALEQTPKKKKDYTF